MNSRDYWAKREAEALKYYIKEEAAYDRELKRIYQNMLDACQKEIESFYAKYAAAEGISISAAKKRVSKLDIAAYERKAAKYVKEKNFSKKANEEMRLYNATMRINRLEMLKANIGLETIAGHDEMEKFMAGILKGRTEDELKRQAGILGKTVKNNAQLANAIVNGSFHNGTFSDRIWQYQDLMREDLGRLLQQGLIQGKGARAIAKDLKKYWFGNDPRTGGGAKYCMERLMRTELARVQTEAQKQSFERNGFDKYIFIVNGGCCSICEAAAKKDSGHGDKGVYLVKDMMPGENASPLHPHCRCSTAAWVDDAEYEAWLEYLEQGGTTEDWQKYKKALENSENGAIIIADRPVDSVFGALSEDLAEKSKEVSTILDSYSTKKSKWSGNTIVKSRDEMVGIMGAKEWSCDIKLRADAGIKTVIHEHLHARSVSHYSKKQYLMWQSLEEGAVELYAQEICRRNGVSYREAYQKQVKQLRIVNSILREYQDDFDFARDLFEIDMPNRYAWLRMKADELISRGVLTKKTVNALNAAVDSFEKKG